MPRARLILGAACMLSAAFVVAGCVAGRPKQVLLEKAETESSSITSASLSKASLVGCWTWLQEDDDDDWVCFDESGHYVVAATYDRLGRDSVGRYIVTPERQLVFDKEDEIIGGKDLKFTYISPSIVSLEGKNTNGTAVSMRLKKDRQNDFYKEISRTYF